MSHLRRRTAALLIVVALLAAGALVARALVTVDTRGAHVAHVTLHSRFVHRALRQTLVRPAGGTTNRPLLVFLHGRGADGEDSNLNDELFAALRSLRPRAPAIVFPTGRRG